MGWLRERQDAETTLNAYRDRAREVRARVKKMEEAGPDAPCPTCGRVLESHYQDVLTELTEEWESVVQDGSWWKSRWEQLEPKQPHLQELEGKSLRFHAALEAGAERVELLRARLGEGSGRDDGARAARGGGAAPTVVVDALRRVRAARAARTLRSASTTTVGAAPPPRAARAPSSRPLPSPSRARSSSTRSAPASSAAWKRSDFPSSSCR